MKAHNILSAATFIILSIILVLIVTSRSAEAARYSRIASGSDVSIGENPGEDDVDNDVGGAIHSYTTPTPPSTPVPTVSKPDIDISSWEFILANNEHSIGSYTPSVTELQGGVQFFDSRAVEDLEMFLQGCRNAGFEPYVLTAYRPYSAQMYLFNGKASQIAWPDSVTVEDEQEARKIVAYPGTSDYQTGLGVAITDKYYKRIDVDALDQDMMAWLTDNCAEYGFIVRYPSNKVSITGWDEPWHFRYVGRKAAEFITDNNLCLEEFIEMYS